MISLVRSIDRFGGVLTARRTLVALCACASLWGASGALAAQQSGAGRVTPATGSSAAQPQPERVVRPDTPDATRDELTQLLESSLRRVSDGSLKPSDRTRAQEEVSAIRQRLEAGDFHPGDRFLLTIIADSVRRAEVIVRDGPSLDFTPLPSLALTGVLRSEVEGAIRQHMSRFFRTPEVRVQFQTRLMIAGAVAKPGTYSVPPFALVSDVLMTAGGLLPSANADKIVVRRGGREVVSQKQYQQAVKDGHTIERLGLQPGDEIRVEERGRRNWTQTATIAMVAVSALTAILALIRSSYSQ